jgi:halimadienyl-diphosphate synthase
MLQTAAQTYNRPSPFALHPITRVHQPLEWLEHEARILLGELRQGTLSPTTYDTAWVAQVPDPFQPTRARFPETIAWLVSHQHDDGSWGATSPYTPDRVLSTLAALAALKRHGQREIDLQAIERGVSAAWRLLPELNLARTELVGFELLLPSLIHQCHNLGLPLPACASGYVAAGQAKLAGIPDVLAHLPELSLAMSVEFMGPSADIAALQRVQGANGSLGNSPAATAYFLTLTEDTRALRYLEQVQQETGDGLPFAHPVELFEPLWVLDHLRRGGVPLHSLVPETFWEWLSDRLGPSGMSFSASFAAPDSDDTAVALTLLKQAGYAVDSTPLAAFSRQGCYVSYPFERNPSTSANIHVLETLLTLGAPVSELRPIVEFLASTRSEGMFWHDKWHLSPYYSTAHALNAFCALPDAFRALRQSLVQPSIEWLTYTQRPDGAWGRLQSTVEETAYALLALLDAERHGWPVLDEVVVRGAMYLEHHASVRDFHPLWIGKSLYAPTNIIHAAVLAARYAMAKRSYREVARTVGETAMVIDLAARRGMAGH